MSSGENAMMPPRRGRVRTEVYASFASEKVKKMPAVKNGFKIEIFNVPTS